jgi:hypothetical protein
MFLLDCEYGDWFFVCFGLVVDCDSPFDLLLDAPFFDMLFSPFPYPYGVFLVGDVLLSFSVELSKNCLFLLKGFL